MEISRDMAFTFNLWSVNSLISKRLDSSLGSVHGIGFTEYMILFHLSKSHNQAMRRIDLANNICLTASGITRLVSPMEKIGLVAKEINPRDARVSLVKITPAGEALFKDASLSVQQTTQRFLEVVSDKNINQMLDVFKAIGKDTFV